MVSFTGILIWLGLMVSLHSGLWQPEDPWLATGLSLATGLLLPGYLLSRWAGLNRTWPWVSQCAAAFLLGLGVLNGIAVVAQSLQLELNHVRWLITSVTLLLALPVLLQIFKERGREPFVNVRPDRFIKPVRSTSHQLLNGFTILLLAITLWLFVRTASTASFFDNQFYLAFIRHFQQDNLAPHYWPVQNEEGMTEATVARASFNGWWIVKAFLNETSGVDLQDWYARTFLFCLLLMALAATYTLTYTLSKQSHTATLSVTLQLVIALSSLNSHEWLGRGFFDRLIEDKFLVVLVLLPTATSLLWHVWIDGNRKVWPLLLLAGAALVFTHPLGIGQWLLVVSGFGGAAAWRSWRQHKGAVPGRIWLIGAGVMLLLAVPLVQSLLHGQFGGYTLPVNATQIVQERTRLVVLSQSWGLYMAHPHLIAHPLTLLSLPLALWVWWGKRQDAAATFLFTATFFPLFIIYNPLTASFLGSLITPTLLYRLAWVLPVATGLAFGLERLSLKTPYWLTGERFLVLAVCGAALPLYGYVYDGVRLLQELKLNDRTTAEHELLTQMAQVVAPGNVIVAPREWNEMIPAYTSQARLLTFHLAQGSLLTQFDLPQFYDQTWVVRSTVDQLIQWQARFIWLPPAHPLGEQMAGLPTLFTLRYENEAGQLWEWQNNGTAMPSLITANTHLIRGEWVLAETFYRESLHMNSDNAPAFLGLGVSQWVQGDDAAAIQSWNQALILNPDLLQPRLWLALLAEEHGQIAAADEQYYLMSSVHPHAVWVYQVWSNLWLREENAAQAQTLYAQVIAAAPETGRYYLAWGDLLWARGLAEPAQAAYQQVLILDDSPMSALTGQPLLPLWSPNPRQSPQAWRVVQATERLAQIYASQEQWNEAEAMYRNLIALAPNEPLGVAPLAELYQANGQPEAALRLYRQAVWRNPFLAWTQQQYASLLLRQAGPDIARAAWHLRWAGQLDRQNIWTYRTWVRAYRLQGEPEQAIDMYEQAVVAFPYWIEAHEALGQQLAAANQIYEAEAVYQAIAGRMPDFAAAYIPLRQLYEEQGRYDEAIALYQSAIPVTPGQSWPYTALAELYVTMDQVSLAAAAYQDAIVAEPGNPLRYEELAAFYEAQGDGTQAHAVLRLAHALRLFHGTE